jgi:hypothetical protein
MRSIIRISKRWPEVGQISNGTLTASLVRHSGFRRIRWTNAFHHHAIVVHGEDFASRSATADSSGGEQDSCRPHSQDGCATVGSCACWE